MDEAEWPQNFLSSDQINSYLSAEQNQGTSNANQHPAFDDAAQAAYMYHHSHLLNATSYVRSSNPTLPPTPSAQPTLSSQRINSDSSKWHAHQPMAQQSNRMELPRQSTDPESRHTGSQTWSAHVQPPIQQQDRLTTTQRPSYERPRSTLNNQNRPPPQSAISGITLSDQATNPIDLTTSSRSANASSPVAWPAPTTSQPSTNSKKRTSHSLSVSGHPQQTRGPRKSTHDNMQGQSPAKITRLDNGNSHVEITQPVSVKSSQPPTQPSQAPSNSVVSIQKRPVIYAPLNPSTGTHRTAQPAHRPQRRATKNRDDLVRPIRISDALMKASYNPATIARDILIAAGKHPNMKGLNHHLEKLRANITQVDTSSDLATFRWELVDVEQNPTTALDARPPPAASAPQQQFVSSPAPITSASTTPAGSIVQWQHTYAYIPPNLQRSIPTQRPISLAHSGPPQTSGPSPSLATPSSDVHPSGSIPAAYFPPARFIAQRSVPSASSASPPGTIPPERANSQLESTQKSVSNSSMSPVIPEPSAIVSSATRSMPPTSSVPSTGSISTQKAVQGPGAPRDQTNTPHLSDVAAFSPRDTSSTPRSARIDERAPPGGLSSWGTLPFQPPTYHSPKRATIPSKFPSGLPRLDPIPEPPIFSDEPLTVSQSSPKQTTKPVHPVPQTEQTPKVRSKTSNGPRTNKPINNKSTKPVAPNQPVPVEVAAVTPRAKHTISPKNSSNTTSNPATTSFRKPHTNFPRPQVVIPPSPDKMQPKRKPGRPPKAKSGSAMVEVAISRTQPVNYSVFHCDWEDCAAELHNMHTMRSHVSKVHIPHHLQCKWKDCEDKEFRAAQRLYEHMAEMHFAKMAWELGDGPTVPIGGEPAEANINVTDPSARKGTMALPVDDHQIKAFSKTHGSSTEKQKARDLFQAGQQWKKRTGPALGSSDTPLSTPARQANLDCDEVCYISSD
ncbi:uncharacterized protein N7511_005929 [Penicillium nucicola]|uniref:uncharacterized protein n=1 Tax=Penicillium nucicola TaxID=1850975 RepID=UPI00254588A2|nr:uncharacterized protein N7511_005929 [Penicillium nucicola]KAJ5762547.1 hypothetical protein N7511_005929 [Penicillium nucicola]